MTAVVVPAETQIRRELLASILINMLFSLIFFLLVFGLSGPVMLGGPGGLAQDFIPQFFMIALMSALVPGWLTARKLAAGKVTPHREPGRLPRRRFPRALLLAAIAGALAAVLALLLNRLTADTSINWWLALALKTAAGGVVAAVVTPLSLHAELFQP